MVAIIRQYVEKWTPHITKYRDAWITMSGQEVEIIRPESIDTNVYGDNTVVSSREIFKVPIVFNWKEYHTQISDKDLSTEESNVPLYGVSRLSDNIRKGTLVRVSMYTGDNKITEQKVVFRVIKRSLFHEKNLHGRRLTMVIHRGASFQ